MKKMTDGSWWRRVLALAVAVAPAVGMAADLPKDEGPEKVAEASDEGEAAMSGFRLAPGLNISLFAAEPHVANIIAMHTDEKGRWYVVEIFRLHKGVPDIRGLMSWLDDDLAARTVEDRLKMHRKHEGGKVNERTKYSDRIRLIEDKDGDGKVETASVFTTGYNAIEDGLAAGVLARKGDVWFTNLPHLWKLKDTNNDGVADVKQSLSYGYGVRVGFIGHDLHGLRFGPDGRIYFSMGDRGLNVKTPNGTIAYPEAGAVLRCEPDGTNLELFAMGLRNPQELAFDDYGNLFTGDNNCDAGDPAKWVYVVEGGDSGWRVGYQHMRDAGPWNAERLHALEKDSLAAYHVPPIAHIGNGPSGVAYYPGTGLSSAYDGHFLMVDFKGSPSTSGIYSFAMKPKGASFEMVDKKEFIWGILPTDVEFGVDGGVYIGDWVQGWGMTGKGRIYKVTDPQAAQAAIVAETRKLIGEGMEKRGEDELVKLLAHRDQRVRQEAQFELAARGAKSYEVLLKAAQAGENQFARIHAVWGLGQLLRKGEVKAERPVLDLLKDPDEQVRAQAAKVLGDARVLDACSRLVTLMEDPSARVRFEAAMAMGRIGAKSATPAVIELLRRNDDRDAYVRHAAVMALVGNGDVKALAKAAADPSAAVRIGAAVALRRLGRKEVELFLRDPDVKVAAEAARAINDVPINEAMGELAKLAGESEAMNRAGTDHGRFVMLRALNANYRMPTAEGAQRLAKVALNTAAPEALRVEAMAMLANWEKPSGRDRVVGLWRPIAERDGLDVAKAIKEDLHGLVHGNSSDAIKIAALRLVEIHGGARDLVGLVKDVKLSPNLRAATLKAMAMRNDPLLSEAVKVGLVERRGTLRREAIRVSMKLPDAVEQFNEILSKGTPADQQAVFSTLASVEGKAAEDVIAHWMDKLLAGQVAPEARLDLLEAAEKSKNNAVKEKVKQHEKKRGNDALAYWSETLVGGDPEAGKNVFMNKSEVSCVRCHRIGGDELVAGPDLKGVGSRHPREYLLESIVRPNAKVAAGFENVRVKTKQKKTYNGMLKSESADELTLMTEPEPGVVKMVTVKKADVLSRESQPSSMPEGMDKMLSRREMRDLVEFLASQKE